jgi:hypothetical protein
MMNGPYLRGSESKAHRPPALRPEEIPWMMLNHCSAPMLAGHMGIDLRCPDARMSLHCPQIGSILD